MKGNLREKLLLFRLKFKKNPEAFGELYDIYHDRIYRFILFKISNSEEAVDLTSETFLRVWQHVTQDRPITNLNALLYSVARNLIIDQYRLRSKTETAPEEVLATIPDTKFMDIIKGIELSGDFQKISEALQKLNDNYKEVLILRFMDELSIAETAEALGITKSNVRVMQHRAVAALRKICSER